MKRICHKEIRGSKLQTLARITVVAMAIGMAQPACLVAQETTPPGKGDQKNATEKSESQDNTDDSAKSNDQEDQKRRSSACKSVFDHSF